MTLAQLSANLNKGTNNLNGFANNLIFLKLITLINIYHNFKLFYMNIYLSISSFVDVLSDYYTTGFIKSYTKVVTTSNDHVNRN